MSGRYTIERELGRGGMAVVYLARDLKHNRRVALKVIRGDMNHPGAAERFTREIRLAAGLNHPHVVPVYDSGMVQGGDSREGGDTDVPGASTGSTPSTVLYYVMPFVEGESLRERLERERRILPAEAVRIVREAAQALGHAHDLGVIHRDVKPENILLSRDGSALVTDFGVARAIESMTGSGHSTQDVATITSTGLVVGTPAYMAPEQRLAGVADARSDLWSLAAVLYEQLTGTRVAPIVMPDDAFRGMSPAIAAVLGRALEVDPSRRFGSMREFADALDVAVRDARETVSGRWRRAAPLASGVAVAAVALLAFELLRRGNAPPARADGAPLTRLAVIPFQNHGDSTDAYFADGMADELSTALVNVPGLRVTARSSAARFRGTKQDARQIGRALGVGTVLEGTVRRSGTRVRVFAQLTSATDDLVLWADRFDREVGDIFAVQDEIAVAIVTALRDRLGGSASLGQAGAPRGTRDLAAYDLYLKGRFAWSKRGQTGLRDAIGYFKAAVARDPTFARAHAGLAMAWVVLPIFDQSLPVDSGMARAARSAARSLELDSTLSDGHLALAYVLKNRWRFQEAERYFRNALALAPDDPAVRHWYGVHLYAVGRAGEAAAHLDVARALDPSSTTVAVDHAIALYAAGRLEEAKAEIHRATAIDPAKNDAHFVMGIIEVERGNGGGALAALSAAARFGTGMERRGYASRAYRALGRIREADSLRAELARGVRTGTAQPYDLAVAAAAAGDRATALDALEATIAARHMFVTELSLPCEPSFRELWSEPRFVAALRQGGMSQCRQR